MALDVEKILSQGEGLSIDKDKRLELTVKDMDGKIVDHRVMDAK